MADSIPYLVPNSWNRSFLPKIYGSALNLSKENRRGMQSKSSLCFHFVKGWLVYVDLHITVVFTLTHLFNLQHPSADTHTCRTRY
jgi:hypothetical protein